MYVLSPVGWGARDRQGTFQGEGDLVAAAGAVASVLLGGRCGLWSWLFLPPFWCVCVCGLRREDRNRTPGSGIGHSVCPVALKECSRDKAVNGPEQYEKKKNSYVTESIYISRPGSLASQGWSLIPFLRQQLKAQSLHHKPPGMELPRGSPAGSHAS